MEYVEDNYKKRAAIKKLGIFAVILLASDIALIWFLAKSNNLIEIVNLAFANVGILILSFMILGGFWIVCELYDAIRAPIKLRKIRIDDNSISIISGHIYSLIYWHDVKHLNFDKKGIPISLVLKDGEVMSLPSVEKMMEFTSLLKNKAAHAL